MNVWDRIDKIATEKGLSAFQLSKRSGIAYSTLQRAKTKNTKLRIDTIEQICNGLQISLAEFFSEENANG